jgi:hypothetical protein
MNERDELAPQEDNPYAAPATRLDAMAAGPPEEIAEAEAIRKAHLGFETNIKSLGGLYYLGAFFAAFGIVVGLVMLAGGGFGGPNAAAMDPGTRTIAAAGITAVYAIAFALNFALGFGLRRLQTWARWTAVVLISLGLLYIIGVSVGLFLVSPVGGAIALVVGGGISAAFLYLLLARKASVVFSPRYKEIIAKTPHIFYRTSLIVKIFAVLLVLVIGFAIVGAIVSSMMRQ